MEGTKYYTPSLEDLHIGFECEEWIESYPEGFWSDVSEPIDKDKLEKILGYCNRNEEYLKQNYRVKYFDREDAEACGCYIKVFSYIKTLFEDGKRD